METIATTPTLHKNTVRAFRAVLLNEESARKLKVTSQKSQTLLQAVSMKLRLTNNLRLLRHVAVTTIGKILVENFREIFSSENIKDCSLE